jgi:DnaJ-class molecular chaperone
MMEMPNKLKVSMECPECGGSGMIEHQVFLSPNPYDWSEHCYRCDGTGETIKEEEEEE